VHTSATSRLTSVAIQIRIRDSDRHQYLVVYSLAHCQASLKIPYKSVRKFLRKVANKQTDKQINNDDYITSLAEVIIAQEYHFLVYTVWCLQAMQCCRFADGRLYRHMYRNRVRSCHVVRSFHLPANVSIIASLVYSCSW